MKKIETEYKLPVSYEEFIAIKPASFDRQSKLKDYFFNISKFDEKGWNFTRIRVYDGKQYEKTQKTWKLLNGDRVREEVERESSLEELNDFITKNPNFPLLTKNRIDWQLDFNNEPAKMSLDEVILPDKTLYFLETEIDVPEELSHSIRGDLKNWMLETFNLTDRPEGQGMMSLVQEYIIKKSD
ncbi:MAG: hypothetical protein COU27_01065 [Candidatus Levybacteria bacterium CG10_big_fil_rev_8_21_14_0_10_36_7]|nr:MAG: hypothetical protein COU27_01065 [Candidatus Levybacteria bacterium CG10_big_fil_rev_8_21_14_0_10_36_7]